jgi:hypothetical protein
MNHFNNDPQPCQGETCSTTSELTFQSVGCEHCTQANCNCHQTPCDACNNCSCDLCGSCTCNQMHVELSPSSQYDVGDIYDDSFALDCGDDDDDDDAMSTTTEYTTTDYDLHDFDPYHEFTTLLGCHVLNTFIRSMMTSTSDDLFTSCMMHRAVEA